MAKIYGTPIMAGGAGGANKDLPPLLDNFKAFKGGGTSENPHITIQADKILESRANELAGAVWVYADHEPTSVNDGTKIQLAREEVVTSDGGEAQTVTKTVEWNNEADFFARQFTYNSKKQYQTMLEGALASVIVEGAPAQVTDLVVSGSGGTATLTWVNPVDDPVYAETVVVWKVGSAPSDITDGTEIYRGTDQTCTATGLEQSTDYYFAVYTVSGLGVYGQPVVSDVYRYDFPAEPTEYSTCAEITATQEYVIPENGYFRIDAIGKSGNGGDESRHNGYRVVVSGGGGTGGHSRSEIVAYAGDIININIGGGVTISSNDIENLNMVANAGSAGRTPTTYTDSGTGGGGGSATGGNKLNEKGVRGHDGTTKTIDPGDSAYGGRGGSKTIEINETTTFVTTGGRGQGMRLASNGNTTSGWSSINRTTGTAAKVFISRGNTNIPSPSAASTLSLTPRNASIEASWTNPEDPESVGTLLVSNPTHEPQDITDGTAVDVAEATSYTLTDLPNDKPTYISLFSYNADKTKYSAAKSDVEIPRAVSWADTHDALVQDVEEKTEQLTTVTEEYEAEVKTMASAGISQAKAYCEATSNPPMADVGVFSSGVEGWKPNTEYKLNDLFTYQGNMGYVKQPTLTSLDVYPPFSVGTEALYGARPKPDADGVYPYVYNMGIYEGMLVRDDDGVLYRSITGTQERPTELLYHPKYVPTLLEKVEEGGEEAPSEEYPEWVRPTGAHDAYAQGAKVSHNGKKWTSNIENNVWEPGVYGWTEVIE